MNEGAILAEAAQLKNRAPDGSGSFTPGHDTTSGKVYADWLDEHPDHPDAWMTPLLRNLTRSGGGLFDKDATTDENVYRKETHLRGLPSARFFFQPAQDPAGKPHYVVTMFSPGGSVMMYRGVLHGDQLRQMSQHPQAPDAFKGGVETLQKHFAEKFSRTGSPMIKITSIEDGDRQYEHLRLARKKKKDTVSNPDLPQAVGLRKDTLGAQLEREAVKHALRAKYGVTDVPAGRLARYVQTIGALAHSQGKSLPGAQAYADHINGFKDDVLSGGAVKQAGEQLANSGLLGHADRVLAKRAEHTPLPEPIKQTTSKPSGFVELPQSQMQHDPTAGEVRSAIDKDIPGKIKPASDETVKPASLAPSAKKARRDENAAGAGEQPEPTVGAEDAPLPLADSPEETKGLRNKDRHRRIADMILRHKPAAIVSALVNEFKISPRAAKDTFNRWIEMRRMGLTPAEGESGSGPTRFARERQGQSNPATRHQVADLHNNVDPMIAGTRLAMHLIQIAKEHAQPGVGYDPDNPEGVYSTYLKQHPGTKGFIPNEEIHSLALHALRGTKPQGFNGDVWAALGRRLRASGSRWANAYNWGDLRTENGTQSHGIGRALKDMAFLKDFLAKNVVRREGMTDRQYYAQVLRQFARDKESQERGYKDQGTHDKFWSRLAGEFKDRPHLTKTGGSMEKRLTDAMYRLHTLADDRETTAEIDATKDRDWRKQTAMQWANKHMKFSRSDLAALSILAHLNPRIREGLTIRGFKFEE